MTKTVLIHYGRKGMKWGRNVYGDRHGPTKTHHPSNDEMKKVIQETNLKNQYAKATKTGPDGYEKAKLGLDVANESLRIGNTLNDFAKRNRKTAPVKTFDTSHLSDVELQKKIQRLNMDVQYNRLMQEPETISRGQARVEKILDVGGVTLATASSVLGIALAVKQLTGN